MKKLFVGVAVVALLGLIVAPAIADTPGQPGPVTLDVNITVEEYCEIELGNTNVDVTLDDGTEPSTVVDFTLRSNTSCTVTLETNNPIYWMYHACSTPKEFYPVATLQGGATPDDSIGYWPQLRADDDDVGVVTTSNPTQPLGGWMIMYWDPNTQKVEAAWTSAGTYAGQVGYSTCMGNTRDGDLALPGVYEGSMTITLTCSS